MRSPDAASCTRPQVIRCRATQWWVCLALLGILLPASSAEEWVRVAYDDAGEPGAQPDLVAGAAWRYPELSQANEAARTVAFGETVIFRYSGLDPDAAYRARMVLSSDGPRELRVMAEDTVVVESIDLQDGSIVERVIDIPASAYADGALGLSFVRLAGPNAVVAEVEILSTNPTPLGPRRLPALPVPVLTPRPAEIHDLSGTWKFSESAQPGFEQASEHDGWADTQVPGEWVMQGFSVVPETPAAYFRTFDLSSPPVGERLKLRFSAVYSLCRVFINGVDVGGHEGGFVPFEVDITDAAVVGLNTLAVSVQSESLADRLSCGSQYASHALGGISRKVQLFRAPDVHISDLKVETTFDAAFENATLTARVSMRNQSDQRANRRLALSVEPIGDARDVEAEATLEWLDLAPGETKTQTAQIAVAAPDKWDNEHPDLYRLVLAYGTSGGAAEATAETFGFREIEVRGSQVLVNGAPIKLRGVCRHEAHPLLGRALTPELWRRDAELYREGNCNFIRTSHYPPAEEFIEQCDALGLFVELEAPLCWVGLGASDTFQGVPGDEAVFVRLARANLDAVQGYPNHPSVIMRSLANESGWSPLFSQVHTMVQEADPTRLTTFHDQCWGGFNNLGSTDMPVANIHYPGSNGPEQTEGMDRPVHFGEYCHLASYNRRELLSDPGLRDIWGLGLGMIWGKMRAAQNCLGGSIWSAMDDTFFLPSGETVGYGTWGPLDGWRRPKPEYWHMKKAYSPLRLSPDAVALPGRGEPIVLEVENRHTFTDLDEVRFEWKLGGKHGVARASGAPGETGRLSVPAIGDTAGELLSIEAISPLGFSIDTWSVAVGEDERVALPIAVAAPGSVTVDESAERIRVTAAAFSVEADVATGSLQVHDTTGRPVITAGPELLLLPMNGDDCGGIQMFGMEKEIEPFTATCSDWEAESVTVFTLPTGAEIHVRGAYAQARGEYTVAIDDQGGLSIRYLFVVTDAGQCDPRQIGLVLTCPADMTQLSWRRDAQWSAYPADHIGRPQGTATAFPDDIPPSGIAGPRVEPSWSWSEDWNANGSNDFRSTKLNILEATLAAHSGGGLRVLSDGAQHVRSWVDGDAVRLLIADYANEGAPPFFSEHVVPHRPLNAGASVEGFVRLEVQ